MTKELSAILDRFRVTKGKGFRLRDVDPDDTGGLGKKFKDDAAELVKGAQEEMAELQDKLYAQDRWAVLFVFQAMDAAGKDGTIKHVMSGVNPQGCEVHSFKQPSAEELDHDYLWRTACRLPERGRIGIFNRSYYEEVLVVRVHPQILEAQRLPRVPSPKKLWAERFEDIRGFERHLVRNGTAIRKFFLHVSKKEQKKRFLERLEAPEKNWKFSASDVAERRYWERYQEAYEDAIRATASPRAPWYVIPADNKWFMRLMVTAAIIDCLRGLKLHYPKPDPALRQSLRTSRDQLLKEG